MNEMTTKAMEESMLKEISKIILSKFGIVKNYLYLCTERSIQLNFKNRGGESPPSQNCGLKISVTL